jgi:N-acetylmuramoyl-L-alanine amidase
MALTLLALAALLAPVICIDPGHPSEVGRGTQGKKVTEVQVAWDVARSLEAKLRTMGYRVVMTKSSLEEKVTNKERAERANQSHASMMVRLHCDASKGSGFAIYYPTQQGTVNGFRGPTSAVLKATAPLAKRFHKAFSGALRGKLKDQGLMSDVKTAVGSKQGALTGSIYSHVPSVLVEMVVLTNARDEAFILSGNGRRAMVDALAAGVKAAVPLKSAIR